jgi:hypothetical protein
LIDGFERDGGLDGRRLHGEKGSTGGGFRRTRRRSVLGHSLMGERHLCAAHA